MEDGRAAGALASTAPSPKAVSGPGPPASPLRRATGLSAIAPEENHVEPSAVASPVQSDFHTPTLPPLASAAFAPSLHLPTPPTLVTSSTTVLPKLTPLPPLPSGLAAEQSPAHSQSLEASREANLRQLAILQSLISRQTQALRGGTAPLSGSASSPLLATSPFPHAPPPTPAVPSHGGAGGTMAPHAHHLHTNLDGLNLLGLDPSLPGLSSVTADELVAAQASLDLWTSTVFSTSSPAATPSALVSSESPLVGIGGPVPFQGHGPDPHHHVTTSSLDWSSLYPNGQQGSPTSSPPVLPPISTFAPPLPPSALRYTPSSSSGIAVPSSFPSFPGSAHHPSDSVGFGRSHASTSTAFGSPPPFAFASPAAAPSASSTTSHRSNTPARRSSRANAGAKGRAARAAAAAAEASEDSGRESPSSSNSAAAESGNGFISPAVIGSSYANGSALGRGKDLMSPDEIEEDKRRRNTEASARFRAKKKLRDAELQQSSASLRDRVASLEKEKDSLTSENRWLRDIVAEKAEVNPRLLNVLRQSMAEQR